MRLKNTLMLAIFYILILAGAGFGLYYLSSAVIKNNQERMLMLEREYVKLEIEHHFHVIETVLFDIETFISLDPNDGQLRDYLVAIDQESDMMASIYLWRSDLTMINSSGFVPGPTFDVTTRIWYQMASAAEEIIFTPAFLNASEDRLIVTAAKAIREDGLLIGIIATDIDIRTVSMVVANRAIGDTGYAFLIDSSNNLIGYPGMDFDDLALEPVGILNSDLADLDGSGVLVGISVQGVTGALAYTEFVGDSYMLGVFMGAAEFSHSLILFTSLISLFAAVILISSVFFYLIYNRNVTVPLKNLLEDIKNIDIERNLEYRLKENSQLGYGDIRLALNYVLEATGYYFQKARSVQNRLAVENQRVRLLMESTADIIFEIDTTKRFVSIFGKGLEKIGKPASDFLGKTVLDCFGAEGIERDIAYTKALRGERNIYDWSIHRDGQQLYFESSIAPISDENGKIVGAVGISRDITEPMKRQKEIEYINAHDYLTGVYNRRFFTEEFSRRINSKNVLSLGLIMLDMNGLKMLNDAFGHGVGDEALQRIATILTSCIGEEDIAARIGGDEFAVIVPNAKETELIKLKNKIYNLVAQEKVSGLPLTIAIGHAFRNSLNESMESLLIAAESEMYDHKVNEGKEIRNVAIDVIMDVIFQRYPKEQVHAKRVSDLSVALGLALGLSDEMLELLDKAAYYHDIGKVSLAPEILYQPRELTEKEYAAIKAHAKNGYHILRGADRFAILAEYALSHHERWDGGGYPANLKGDKIPLFSRIIAIADAYEAMTSARPYREKLSAAAAIAELKANSGTQFDPHLVDLFVTAVASQKQ